MLGKKKDLNLEDDYLVEDRVEAANKDVERAKNKGRIRQKLSDHKKKLYISLGAAVAGLIILALVLILWIRPNQTAKYNRGVWYKANSASTESARYLESEISLETAQNTASSLQSYARRLDELSYESRTAGSFTIDGAKTGELAKFLDSFANYSDSAAALLGSITSPTSTLDQTTLDQLSSDGKTLQNEAASLVEKYKLEPSLNTKLFELSTYIDSVKLKDSELKAQAAAEELNKKQDEEAQAAKKEADKQKAVSAAESYLKAFVSGNEQAVRSAITTGYASEYNFANLSPESRLSYYPKTYRVLAATAPEDPNSNKYEVSASVTYIGKYTDANGQISEAPNAVTQKFRVVYVESTMSWKVDGEVY